jgi:peptidoglycan/xylan/chitin deacetylase (PgdA/CDA1 family)
MRLATVASVLAIVGFLAVFGILLANKVETSPPRLAAQGTATSTDASSAASAAKAAAHPVTATFPIAASDLPGSTVALRTTPRDAPVKVAQSTPTMASTTPPEAAPKPASPPVHHAKQSCPGNPNALGVSRVVEVDTTGGPGFGFEHFKMYDFLRPGEIVLTFDDGPWPHRTQEVLKALAAHCTKAIFFPIGKHATYEPGLLKEVVAAGHVVGSHTWSHQNLARKTFQEGKDEIEKGISAVSWAIGGPIAPFFRFPALRHPPELLKYLGKRNVAIFSTDIDSFDFKLHRPEQVRKSVLTKLKRHGKGILLLHDFQPATAAAAMDLLNDLKANGYKVVFMKPKFLLKSLPAYDEEFRKSVSLPTVTTRPTSSVIHTISE